jgi:HrpA-like RNA helicase
LERYFKTLSILAKIYYGQQLPITEHLQKFNQLLQSNDAVIVKVGTGSGKSTVIPPYLVGLGYKKVIVTQPRRLPCHQIYKRVSDVFGAGICGYEIADACEDENNSLIYMTDGLLKMKALFDEK